MSKCSFNIDMIFSNTTTTDVFSSSSTLINMGDYIGVESCLDLKKSIWNGGEDEEEDDIFTPSQKQVEAYEMCCEKKREEKWAKTNKRFPPPIPLLARTENLTGHMPWVLKRYYTNDGRLILREEKVKHHEYFRAHREDGRLTLDLVPLDHQLPNLVPPPNNSDLDHQDQDQEVVQDLDQEEEDDEVFITEEEEEEDEEEAEEEAEMGGGGDQRVPCIGESPPAGKCMDYNGVLRRSSSSSSSAFIFGVHLPALRPVH